MSSVENTPVQGITLYSHADDFRSHWIRFLAEKQIKYHLIITDHEDEDLLILIPTINYQC
jgi:RNA polymerase-associated protein